MYFRKERGFTLLELMIAVAIFSVIGVAMYSQFSQVLKSKELTDLHAKSLSELQRAMTIIQNDFSQIIARSARDEFGEEKPAVQSLLGSGIEFTRIGWSVTPFSAGNRSDVQRVSYRIEDDELIRGHWQHPDRGASSRLQSTVLLSGVNGMEVTYWYKKPSAGVPKFGESGPALENTQEWPQLSTGGTATANVKPNTELPAMIEIELDIKQKGEYRRLFTLVDTIPFNIN